MMSNSTLQPTNLAGRYGLVLILILPLLHGCTTTSTAEQRSALIPRTALPASMGAPIGKRGAKFFGHANSIGLQTQTKQPDIGDDGQPVSRGALLIPRYQLGGGMYFAFNRQVEVGAQLNIAGYDSAEPNFTRENPDYEKYADKLAVVGGVGARGNYPIPDTILTGSLHFELNVASAPQAVTVTRTGFTGTETRSESFQKNYFVFPSLYASLTLSPFDDLVHFYPFFGAQRGVSGFSPDTSSPVFNTLSGYPYFTGGAGVELRYSVMTLGANLFIPLGEPEEIDFGPSAAFTIGVIVK